MALAQLIYLSSMEGDAAQVLETFARICSDKRHQHIVTLCMDEVQARHFGGWSMGYKHIDASVFEEFAQYASAFDFRRQPEAIKELSLIHI